MGVAPRPVPHEAGAPAQPRPAPAETGTPAQDRRSALGLDWLNFFTATLQTAFGPFVAVYLTQRAWTQGDIGLALGVGYAANMAAQVPAGALVDAMARKGQAAAAAIIAIIAGALTFAFFPTLLPVLAAEVSHAFASCMLGPAIAAISLGLASRMAIAAGERLGRNARYASVGNGTAAALMAAVGYQFGPRAVFLLGALIALPGLLALRMIATVTSLSPERGRAPLRGLVQLLADRRLLWFGACCACFHLSNAAMLPLAAGAATRSMGNRASLVIGACIVGPQLVVAALSPAVGRAAEQWGRRPVLAAGMLALPARGAALALIALDPAIPGWQLIAVQLLDGFSGAAFGVLLPLVAADIARANGRFNLCMGVLGLAIGAAAAASTVVAGRVADGSLPLAFLALAGAGAIGVVLASLMPETK